jgi:hypothetical protein
MWFNNACDWSTHLEKTLKKLQRVKGGLMAVWKSRHISLEVKRIILLTCVRPVVEYGSEVWFGTSHSVPSEIWQFLIEALSRASNLTKSI